MGSYSAHQKNYDKFAKRFALENTAHVLNRQISTLGRLLQSELQSQQALQDGMQKLSLLPAVIASGLPHPNFQFLPAG